MSNKVKVKVPELLIFYHDNLVTAKGIITKLGEVVVLDIPKNFLAFGVKRSKVKVTGSKRSNLVFLLLYTLLLELGLPNFFLCTHWAL